MYCYTSSALQQYYSTKETIIIYYLNYFIIIFVTNPNNLRLRIWIVPVFYDGFSPKKNMSFICTCRNPILMWVVKKEWKFKKSMKVTEVNNF